jgi:hypothetical protein
MTAAAAVSRAAGQAGSAVADALVLAHIAGFTGDEAAARLATVIMWLAAAALLSALAVVPLWNLKALSER